MTFTTGQSIFKKVGASERKILLTQACEDGVTLLLKTGEEIVINLLPKKIKDDDSILCAFPSEFELQNSEKSIVSFHLGVDRYFFEARLRVYNEIVILSPFEDLFILQRRSNARIILPEIFPGYFEFQVATHKNIAFKAKILDFSAGGVKLRVHAGDPIFKENDILEGVLLFNERRPIAISGEVRFNRTLPSAEIQILGVQFTDVEKSLEGRLLGLVLDIQREIDLKFNPRKQPKS